MSEATPRRCKNTISDGGFRAPRCSRDANPEKDGLCNVCAAALKRGAAKRAATDKRYNEQYAERKARQAEIDRKVNAHDAMLEALKAIWDEMDSDSGDQSALDAITTIVEPFIIQKAEGK